MKTDEERRAASACYKGVSVKHSQETPEAVPHAITTMVNYIGVTDIESEGARTRFSEDNPKMHKPFPRQEVLISKGERFINFLPPQSVSGYTKFIKAQDI